MLASNRLSWIWVILCGNMGVAVQAEPYCSLHVFISARESSLREEFPVVVQESNGWRSQVMTKGGLVKFCNLGVEPVTVTVGSEDCIQVVARNVRLYWKTTVPLRLTYDDAGCPDTPPSTGCWFLYRFVGHNNEPIQAVSLTLAEGLTHVSDDYGRVLIAIGVGRTVKAEGTAPGYKPVAPLVKCENQEVMSERIVRMEKN